MGWATSWHLDPFHIVVTAVAMRLSVLVCFINNCYVVRECTADMLVAVD